MTLTFPYDKLHDCLCLTMRYVLSLMPSMKQSLAKRLLCRRTAALLPTLDSETPPPVGVQPGAMFGYDEVDIGEGDTDAAEAEGEGGASASASASANASSASCGQGSSTKPSACLPPLAEALDRLHRLSPLANCSLRLCRIGTLDSNGEPVDYSSGLSMGMPSPGFLGEQFLDPFGASASGATAAEKANFAHYTFDECAPRVDRSGHMNAEATRRLSFASWPHMSYKY